MSSGEGKKIAFMNKKYDEIWNSEYDLEILFNQFLILAKYFKLILFSDFLSKIFYFSFSN